MITKITISSLLLITGTLAAVPLTIISPLDINANAGTGYTISRQGSYILSDDVAVTAVTGGQQAINIQASHVVLDLNNKTISGSAGVGVRVTSVGDITIRNGRIFNGSDTGIIVAGVTNVRLENLNVSNNAVLGISVGSSSAQCFIRDCISESNTGTGISLTGASDVHVLNCTSEANGMGISVNGENVRIVGGQCNRNVATGITVVTSTQVVIEQVQAKENRNIAGIALVSGADCFVNNCLAQKNTGTGIAIANTMAFSTIAGCKALHNSVDGFGNNSGNSSLFGNIAFGNVSNNYGGTGRYAFIQANNGAQTPPGSVIDPQLDNISIV